MEESQVHLKPWNTTRNFKDLCYRYYFNVQGYVSDCIGSYLRLGTQLVEPQPWLFKEQAECLQTVSDLLVIFIPASCAAFSLKKLNQSIGKLFKRNNLVPPVWVFVTAYVLQSRVGFIKLSEVLWVRFICKSLSPSPPYIHFILHSKSKNPFYKTSMLNIQYGFWMI